MKKKMSSSVVRTAAVVGGIVGGLVGGVYGSKAGREAVRWAMGTRAEPSVDRVLMKTASQINKGLPMMVDRNTRLDTTTAMPGKKLAYRYTLIGIDPPLTGEQIRQQLRPSAVNNYKTSPDMEGLRKSGVTLVYQYVDEAGKHVGRFEVSVDDFAD